MPVYNHKIDFAILVIVPEAMEAVDAIFGPHTRSERREGQMWRIWEVEAQDGESITVVIEDAVDRSNMPAFEATSLIINTWRPRFLLVADIGGGFQDRDGLSLGDLVVASELEYYSLVKEIPGGKSEPRSFPIAEPSRGPRKDLSGLTALAPGWSAAAAEMRPSELAGVEPKILPGQLVVGERLLGDPESPTVAELADRYPKALALDMESVGVGRAVWSAQQQERFTQFAVLRGISDYVDADDLDNQKTRDRFKPYAAAVAIAAVRAYIGTHLGAEAVGAEHRPQEGAGSSPGVEEFLTGLRGVLAEKARDKPRGLEFRLPLRATPDRKSGSSAPEDPDATIERSELLDIVEHDALVVITGKSGAGKSGLLNVIARQLAAGDEPVVVPLDLKAGWFPSWGRELPDELHGELLDRSMEALLNAAVTPLTIDELNAFIGTGEQVILLVDALNEVPPEVAKRIRETLTQYVRRHRAVGVLATDRRAGLDYRELSWTVLELPVLGADEVRRVVDGRFGEGTYDAQPEARRDILGIPFFLDRALAQGNVDFDSRADLMASYLEEGGLDEEDFETIGRVALDILCEEETTLSEEAQARLGRPVLEKLRDGGFVIGTEAGLVFSHQLIHQYLAGRHLALDPTLWRPEVMDAITFSTASLDGVAMAVKAIAGAQQRDEFLQRVYDWNWRAAVVALSEARTGERRVSAATEQAILAMAAEKRFDPVEGTRKRITGLLEKVDSSAVEPFYTKEEKDLHSAIEMTDHPEIGWWSEWKKIFLAQEPEEVHSEVMFGEVASASPLIGWMAANALRRVPASAEDSKVVRTIYRSHPGADWNDATIRWRIVHTLGAWPCRENADLLIEAIGDPDRWCRYGAVRSLVEMAARTDDHSLRERIVQQLSERWRGLDPEPLSQVAWAARYTNADAAWPGAIRPLIAAIRDAQQDEELERWDQRLAAFDRYAARHANGDGHEEA